MWILQCSYMWVFLHCLLSENNLPLCFLISTHLLIVRVLQHFYALLICAGTLEHFVRHLCAVIAQFTRCLFFLYFNNIAVIRQAVYSIIYYTNNVCSRFRWHNGTPNTVSCTTQYVFCLVKTKLTTSPMSLERQEASNHYPGSNEKSEFVWKKKRDLIEILTSRLSLDMLRSPFRLVKWHISPPRFFHFERHGHSFRRRSCFCRMLYQCGVSGASCKVRHERNVGFSSYLKKTS